MTTSQVNKGINQYLYPFLKAKGYKKGKSRFLFEDKEFSHLILYSSLVGDRCRPTSLSFYIASSIIGDILELSVGGEKGKNIRTLVAHKQKRVFNMRPKEFPIENEEDIVKMCDAVKEYLENDGFQFYESYKNFGKILEEMKQVEVGKYYIDLGFMHWSLNSIAISKYLNDPEYDEWLLKIKQFVVPFADVGHPFRDRFDKLAFFLEEHDSQSLRDLVNNNS